MNRTVMLILLLLAGPAALMAEDAAVPDSEVFARRGDGVVTFDMFDARAWRIPEVDRFSVLRDRRRLQDLLGNMLLNAQLAADARAAGLHLEPEVQARMQLAMEEELARAWSQAYPQRQQPADYEAIARENYLVQKEQFKTEKTLDLTHILIGTAERSDEEALALAEDLYQRLQEGNADITDLVGEYSDDPSAVSNQGMFRGVKRGQMEKSFEDAAFSLNPGDISEPVQTPYGYHLIRLDAVNEPRQQSFEELAPILVDRARRRHEERVRNDYLSYLSAMEVEMSLEALEEMVRRQFGDEAVAGANAAESSE